MNDTCYLCGEKILIKRDGSVRDNGSLEVFECSNCGLVFLSSFDHVTDLYYEESGMHGDGNTLDINAWIEETSIDDNRRYEQFRNVIAGKDILDFGCGNGGFLLKSRIEAKNACGVEIERRLKKYFNENRLNVYDDISLLNMKFDYIFLFHVLEHIPDPVSIISRLKKYLKPGGRIIVEVPNADDALLTLYKSMPFSNFTYWSPHLYLFNQNTLLEVFNKSHMKKEYIKQFQRYSLSNHLYWLSNGKPGGHKLWNFIDSPELNNAYSDSLAKMGKCDTIIGSFYLNE